MIYLNLFRARKLLLMSLRSLEQQKMRAILSALGVIFGVTAVFAMICIGEGAKRQALRQIEGLGTKNILIKAKKLNLEQRGKAMERLSQGLRFSDTERIRNGSAYVERISALKEVNASIRGVEKEITPKIVAVTADYRDIYSINLKRGRFISNQDVNRKNLVCVLGHDVAKSVGSSGGVGNYIQIESGEFKVIGVLNKYNIETAKGSTISPRDYNNMVFIPLGAEMDAPRNLLTNAAPESVSEITAKIKDAGKVLAASRIIKRILSVSHSGVEDYFVIVPQELIRQARETHRTFTIVLASIAGISLLVGGIGIMNIMLATVSERKKEIGIRRAVGANQRHIMVQFLSEALLLTFIGGVLGLFTGLIFVSAISYFSGWEVAIVPWAVALSLAMSVCVGIFFGIYPAYNAARMDPIEALRS